MYIQSLVFIIATLLVLNGSRLAICLWQLKRVNKARGWWPIFFGGARMDANVIATVVALPLLLAPWLGTYYWAGSLTALWYASFWLLIVFMEICSPQFILEYDTRPNRLFIEYLKHPKEVMGMLWRGFKVVLIAGTAGFILMLWVAWQIFSTYSTQSPIAWYWAILLSFASVLICFLCIRGTLKRRPINPSTVAFSHDHMLNTLALSGLYSVLYALYAMKYELSAQKVYGKMDPEDMNQRVCASANIKPNNVSSITPTMHHQEPSIRHTKPKNIVLIVEESLGAQYVQCLGGQALTPNLNALYEEGWGFKQCYATGTRSVRGLEAITAGFAPTITQAVFKLPNAQNGFFTLAGLLDQFGYHSRFVYGGEAHFDNMKGFFLGNGFKEVVDGPLFENTQFIGNWGYCDEDLFHQVDRLLQADHAKDQPTLTLAFSVSNHTPWEYPEGRIQVEGNPATVENTVRYADYALGKFFEQAKQREYWDDTIFLVVADHDSRVFGASLVPLKHFHIPAVILGSGIEPRTDERLISQLDLAPTLLSLAGIESTHPMIGHDLSISSPNRAMMQYDQNYGYLAGDQLLVLAPRLGAKQFTYTWPQGYESVAVDPELEQTALAHALWPHWSYMQKNYTVHSV